MLEDRYDQRSTVVATQVPTKSWHELLGLTSLMELRLKSTSITWAQVGAVQKALPRVRVIKSP